MQSGKNGTLWSSAGNDRRPTLVAVGQDGVDTGKSARPEPGYGIDGLWGRGGYSERIARRN